MKTCSQCGFENRDAARFCQNCAAPLVAELVCPSCGMANPVVAKFCLNCATPLRGQTPPAGLTGMLPANTMLAGRYTVLSKLGKGGMGAVYLVSDNRLAGKQWAVKEMSDAALTDPGEKRKAVEAFQREATLLASLNHPNLTKVVDYFAEGGKHYLVMDYVSGQTLEETLDARTVPFAEAQVVAWAEQLCDVLSYLHSQATPIIFRDLKPGNIMIDQNGRLRLIDFGVARLFKPGQSRDTENFGTAGYAPPEQYGKGQTDARSDVYALGATLHQMLTLRDPTDEPFKFPAVTALNSVVSPHVNMAVMRAVEQDRDRRWSSAVEMAKALKQPMISVQTAPPHITPVTPTFGVSSTITAGAQSISLTDEERRVLDLLGKGLSNIEIADELKASDSFGSDTFSRRVHVSLITQDLIKKFGARDKNELIECAFESRKGNTEW
jgi:serine/threonine-protein kinase